MHYNDEIIKDNNVLEIVIYTMTGDPEIPFEYMIQSIQKCQYISPYFLKTFLGLNLNDSISFQEKIKQFKLDGEKFYLLTIKETGYHGEYNITNCFDTSNSENEFYNLH